MEPLPGCSAATVVVSALDDSQHASLGLSLGVQPLQVSKNSSIANWGSFGIIPTSVLFQRFRIRVDRDALCYKLFQILLKGIYWNIVLWLLLDNAPN